jgi:predicted GIY-YIG superfamily endonuclease
VSISADVSGTSRASFYLMTYYVYILLCSDNRYYVGYTTDLETREQRHNEGRGGTYTSLRRPVRLVYFERRGSLRSALERERQIKRWTRAKKEALIVGDNEGLRKLSPTPHSAKSRLS